MFTIRGKLISIFTKDTGVIRVGADYLRFAALSYVPYACMFALSGSFAERRYSHSHVYYIDFFMGSKGSAGCHIVTITKLWSKRRMDSYSRRPGRRVDTELRLLQNRTLEASCHSKARYRL